MIYNAFKEIFKEDCILSKVEIKDRIKEAIEIREITQSELAEKAKIDKGQLSSYISGKYKPRQNNIDALSLALNVNEAWLMGFDVPMERDYEDQKVITHDAIWDEVEELLQQAGYHIIASDGSDIVTITNSKQEIICSVHVYELVGIYQTLMENNNLSAQALITKAASAAQKYMEIANDLKSDWQIKSEQNQKESKQLEKIKAEIDQMKTGSIALVDQITTVSKIRIYDPRNAYGVLSGIRLSPESLDRINSKIKELFVF